MPPARPADAIPLITSIAPVAEGTTAWLTDIWGVMHNGVRPFADACAACIRYRETGGLVVLISNSPRPREAVAQQLDRVGVPRETWDIIVSSGDVARTLIASYAGRGILHLGPERDLPIFLGLDVTRVGAETAEAVVCTGLFDDERETPDDYRDTLEICRARELPMICANPDLTVERDDRIIYCAGAIAQAYEQKGGIVAYAGKPFAPIYELTFAILEEMKPGSADRATLIAIGDGIATDIAGAAGVGVRSVFVASGVHAPGGLNGAAIGGLFPPGEPRPIAAMAKLVW